MQNKCPACHKGSFWPSKNPYKNLFLNKTESNSRCNHCGLKYEREPGFWYGAMYVSYGLQVGLFVVIWLFTHLAGIGKTNIWEQIGIMIALGILLAPVAYYFSRLIYLNFFVAFDPSTGNKNDSVS